MKKGFKILAWILAAILILLLGLVVAVQSPRVQTALARKAVAKFADKIDGDISVGHIAVRPFDAVTIEDVVITDRNPYTGGEFAPQDTLARIGSLSARFSLKGLLHQERVSVSRLKLEDAELNLVLEPGQNGKPVLDNISRIFRLSKDPDKPKKDFGDLLEAKKVDIEDFTFRMFNHVAAARHRERGGKPLPADVIDWNDLEVKADVHASDLLVKDGVISGDVDRITITDKTGWNVREISGKVKVGHEKVLLDNLHIDDGDSDLHFRYFRLLGNLDDDYDDFVNRVRLEGQFVDPTVFSMQTVRHFAPNLERFTFKSDLTGKMEGTVSDFAVKGIDIREHGSGIQGRVDGTMKGLPDINTTTLDYRVKDFRFGLGGLGTFIQEWAPDTKLNLGKLGKGTDFHLDATAKGVLDRLAVKGNLTSNAGAADVDLTLRNVLDHRRPIAIDGVLRTRDLDAGRIAGIDALGPVTLTTGVGATLAPRGMAVRIDSLNVARLSALGYDYTGIEAVGTYTDQAFDGRIVCDDPNLNALIQGKFDLSPNKRNAAYEFYANIGYADLNALHIDKRGTSKVSLQADANFIRTREQDLLGEVNLRDIVLENANGRHRIGNITASAHANDDIHRMRFESGFAQGTFVGEKSLVSMVSDLKDLVVRKELPSLLEKPGSLWDGTPYELNFKFFDTRELLGFILPGLYIEKNSALQLKVDGDGGIEGNLTSGRLAIGNRYLKDFRMDLDNRNNALRADVTGSEINLGGIALRGNHLDVMVDDDRINLAYTFDNQTGEASKADLRLTGDLARDADGLLAVTASMLPSDIYYHGERWLVDSDDVTFKGGDLRVDRFRIRNGRQSLVMEGGLSPDKTDTLAVRMEQFDISLLNSLLMKGKMDIKGQATGHASIVSPSKPTPALLASIACDSTYLAGKPMGTVQVGSVWNEPEKRFDVRLRNLRDGIRNFDASGWLRPRDKVIQANAVLNRLELGYAAPLLEGVFDRFEGALDGKVNVDGSLDKLEIGSEGMRIVDGVLGVAFTQVAYQVSGPVSVDTEGLHFQSVSMADGSDGKGSVTGSLLFGGFKDMRLDTHIQFDRMKVLGITDRNSPIFGDVYGTGRVDITGPFNALALNVDARTVKDGNLHIPLGTGGAKATGDLLVFKEPYVEVEEDPYEQMMQATRTGKKKTQSDLDVRVRVRATPAVTAYVDIGENTLQGLGNGLIDVRIRTGGSNQFAINGDYTLTQGEFKFSALDVVTREFTIRDGSSIRFGGDVMDSDLNVTGVYSTKASISTLLSSTASAESARRQVDCLIGITGKLRNPQISFDIEIPELDPGTEGLVSSALNTEDKKMKQFLYLLIANSFLPNEESGITNGGSNMLYSNMSGIMAGQLNSIFDRLNIPLDLGLNYQQNASGQNLFDVALSTQLFNNRVVVNGTIGNRRLYGTTTDEVAGDLDIDIKLDKPGTFRLNLFSHSADQYTSFLDNSQRNGVGFAYQREFNSLGQFFRDLFTPRREREAQEALQPIERTVLQIDTAGKAHPIVETPAHE